MKLIISLFIFLTTFTCANPKQAIVIKQSKANKLPIIFGTYKSNTKEIAYLKLPNTIELKNSSYINLYLDKIYYKTNYPLIKSYKQPKIRLYTTKNKELKPVFLSKNQLILGKKSIKYTYYLNFILDTTAITQQQLKSFLTKKQLSNKDTIHLGTIANFKKHHSQLFNKLTYNDSIKLVFFVGLGNKKQKMTVSTPGTSKPYTFTSVNGIYKSFKIPVKWY